MVTKVIGVKSETLKQLDELASQHNLKNREIIEKAVEDYWTKLCVEKSLLTFEPAEDLWVKPQSQYKKFLLTATREKGPYKVSGTYKSWLGLSEGVYKLEDSNLTVPSYWFKTQSINVVKILHVGLTLVQSGALVYLLLL